MGLGDGEECFGQRGVAEAGILKASEESQGSQSTRTLS